MAKRWQSPAKNACLRGAMNPQKFSRGVPGRGPKATACRARGPAGRYSGAAAARERAWPRSRPLSALGVGRPLRPLQALHDDGSPVLLYHAQGRRAEGAARPRRCVSTVATTNDGEDGLKMFGTGCFMLRRKHLTGTACGLSSFAVGKPQRVRLPNSVAVRRERRGFRNFVRFLQRCAFF
jgi:hypothetical protein